MTHFVLDGRARRPTIAAMDAAVLMDALVDLADACAVLFLVWGLALALRAGFLRRSPPESASHD